MKLGFICWMRERMRSGFRPFLLWCTLTHRIEGIDSELKLHPHTHTDTHIYENIGCWLIQASSSRPIGAWSNPVIRPNRCCWQNNKQGANMAAWPRGGHEPNSSQQQQDRWLARASWSPHWSHTLALTGWAPDCDSRSQWFVFWYANPILLCLQCHRV